MVPQTPMFLLVPGASNAAGISSTMASVLPLITVRMSTGAPLDTSNGAAEPRNALAVGVSGSAASGPLTG